MKILEKTVMPDGTPIQLEDWSDRNTPEYPNLYGLMIGAYPKQKRGCCNPYPYPGREFRSVDMVYPVRRAEAHSGSHGMAR